MDGRCHPSLLPHPHEMWNLHFCVHPPFFLVLRSASLGFSGNTQYTNHEQKQPVSTSCTIDVMIVDWRKRLPSVLEAAACVACCMCVCVCVFNLHNICFLRSFPAATNCWLSFVFDKRRRRKKDTWRNGAQAQHRAKLWGVFLCTFCRKIHSMGHIHCLAVKFGTARCLSAGLKKKISALPC